MREPTEFYAIFQQKRTRTQTVSEFCGNWHHICIGSIHRVCVSSITIPETHKNVNFFSGHHLSCVNTPSFDLDDLCGSFVGDLTERGEVVTPAREFQEQCCIPRFFHATPTSASLCCSDSTDINDYEHITEAEARIGHFIRQVSNQKRPHPMLENHLIPVEGERQNLSSLAWFWV